MKKREINTQQITSIKLPQSLRRGRVFVIEDKDILIVKKNATGDFSYVRKKLRKLDKKISQKDIDRAIQTARAK